jgi:hypothetical protein
MTSPKMKFDSSEYRCLRMMRDGELRLRNGQWRFGAGSVGKGVVDRLVARGKIERNETRAWLLGRHR